MRGDVNEPPGELGHPISPGWGSSKLDLASSGRREKRKREAGREVGAMNGENAGASQSLSHPATRLKRKKGRTLKLLPPAAYVR